MDNGQKQNAKLWLGIGVGVALGIFVSRRRRPPAPPPGSQQKDQIVIGFPDEWRLFGGRNPAFLESIPLLFDSTETILNRTVTMNNLNDRVIYYLSKIVAEDFTEVFILCGNGHGIGGLKVLRGMYERIVTLTYIANNPDKAESFWNYYAIHKYKMLIHAEKAGVKLSKEIVDATKVDRDKFKEDYMDACDHCGAKRPLPSWIKGGMDTMNAGATAELRQRYLYCYYWSTLHDHATPNNIIERLQEGQGESDAQRGWADIAISSAHSLLINTLQLNNSRFNLGIGEQIEGLWGDWKNAWIKKPPTVPQ